MKEALFYKILRLTRCTNPLYFSVFFSLAPTGLGYCVIVSRSFSFSLFYVIHDLRRFLLQGSALLINSSTTKETVFFWMADEFFFILQVNKIKQSPIVKEIIQDEQWFHFVSLEGATVPWDIIWCFVIIKKSYLRSRIISNFKIRKIKRYFWFKCVLLSLFLFSIILPVTVFNYNFTAFQQLGRCFCPCY